MPGEQSDEHAASTWDDNTHTNQDYRWLMSAPGFPQPYELGNDMGRIQTLNKTLIDRQERLNAYKNATDQIAPSHDLCKL